MDADSPLSCPRCGWPEAEPYDIVSRHVTSEGMIVYSRCACGRLQVRRDGFMVIRSGCSPVP